jgi:hypothetical protein
MGTLTLGAIPYMSTFVFVRECYFFFHLIFFLRFIAFSIMALYAAHSFR